MITLKYKAKENLHDRTATQLNWHLNQITSSIYIINSESRQVNAKSLIGLLSADIKENDIFTILIEEEEIDVNKIKEILKEFCSEVS